MRKVLAGLITVLVISPADAQSVFNPFRAVLPPAEFDHPYKGNLTIRIVPNNEAMYEGCDALPRIPGRPACSRRLPGSCIIYIRSDKVLRAMNWAPEIVMRHEIGHCNGWPEDHRGARRIPPLEIERYY